ncbi:Tetratricopeptide repeat protein 39B [Halotydeus destructor]|nr:Tetratricopeptide repeat protein 39B [Halotydeus destructor]
MASKPKAVDQNENVESGGKVVTLQQGLDSAIRGLDLFFENKFIDSKQLLSEHRDTSLYHAVGLSYYLICYAIFTCEKPLIEEARDVLTGALKLCEKKRKVNSIKQTLSNLFSKQDFNEYTDEEAHAEICYAELSFMMVFCNFTADQSFLSIVRGVRNMMTAHAAIKLVQMA